MPASSLPAQAQQPASHTPGPWRWNGTNKQPKAFCYLYGPDYDVAGCALDGFTDNAANARLIAAAPDLLEACQWALSALDGLGLQSAEDKVRAALAQATQPSPSHE
jgi:hypothetical protein